MENSKKNLIGTIAAAVVVLLIVGISAVHMNTQKQNQINQLQSEKAAMVQTMQQKDSIMNDAENTFSQIEENLKFIAQKRQQIAIDQKEGGKNRKQQVVEDIKFMNSMLEASDKQIADLQAKLRKSGVHVHALEQRIAALNESLTNQNNEIAALKKVIEDKDNNLAQLNTKVNDMSNQMARQSDTITYKQQQIANKTNELNTGHFVLGTFKELKSEGILTREGGLLGLGSSKAIQENFSSKYFKTVDIRDTKTIPLNARKARMISEHPDSSYQFVEKDGQIASLEIKDPAEFWRISKYAVIEIK
jgi:uncharacterized coiled-coil protein SlyX